MGMVSVLADVVENLGWSEKLEADGTLHVTAPDGRTWTTTPPGVLSHLPE